MRKKTREEIETIKKLREGGFSLRKIREQTGFSINTIRQYLSMSNDVSDNVSNSVSNKKENQINKGFPGVSNVITGVSDNVSDKVQENKDNKESSGVSNKSIGVSDAVSNSVSNDVIQNLKETISELQNQVYQIQQKINDLHILYNNILNILERNSITQRKDKKIKNKTISKDIVQVKSENEIIEVQTPKKIKEPQPAIQLIFDFASLLGIKVDRGFIERNLRDAHKLISQYQIEDILGLVNWIINNDDYWRERVVNLAIVYKNFAIWEKKFKESHTKNISVSQWLAKHPEYKPVNEKGTIERYRELLRIFNLAFKDKNVIPTKEEWKKYRIYRQKILGGEQ